MDFLSWLHEQLDRKDSVGWLAHLYEGQELIAREITSYHGTSTLKKYAQSFTETKIRQVFAKAVEEWTKVALSWPRIGIFWEVDGEILDFSVNANEVPVSAGFKDGPYDHNTMWNQVTSLYPALRRKEYPDIPRGRVLGIGPDKYRIFVEPGRESDTAYINKVMKTFALPRSKTEVMSDEHYSLDFDPFDED